MLRSNHIILISFVFCIANVLISAAFSLIADEGLYAAAEKYFGTSLLLWAAIFIACQTLLRLHSKQDSRYEIALSLALMLLCTIPSTTLNWLCLGVYALVLMKRSSAAKAARRNGASRSLRSSEPINEHNATLVLIAIIAFREPIVSQSLRLFTDYILAADVWFVQMAAYLSLQSVEQVGTILFSSAGHGVMILSGCSSLANLSLALLLFYSLNFSTRGVLSIIILVISLNTLRLTLMLQDVAYYNFFHNTTGLLIFEVSMILGVLFISSWRQKHYV